MSDNAAWLSQLDKSIWDHRVGMLTYGRSYCYRTVKRQLTVVEWERVQELAFSHEFVIEPHNAGHGFGFGITFYQPPCFVGMPPECIFTMEGGHLPEGMKQGFTGAWLALNPLSHNVANAMLLEHFNFKPIEKMDHYR